MNYKIPSYLSVQKDSSIPLRSKNLEWLKNAKYGMFVHFGLYSLLGRGEWVQYNESIPVDEYAKLKDSFFAKQFDADKIVNYAIDCGMKYITFTTKHHDGFCMWDSKSCDFNSMNSPAQRDFVGELATACEKRKIALFLYYSHGRDWKFRHGPDNESWGGKARPVYKEIQPAYCYGSEHNIELYNQYVLLQIKELIEKYPTAAGIWFDGVAVPLSGGWQRFNLPRLYESIRSYSPHMLISYKHGVTGTEDYFAPEHIIPKKETAMGVLAENNYTTSTKSPLIEVCTAMLDNPGSWGTSFLSTHKTVEEVNSIMEKTIGQGANLLLNSAPLSDGSIDEIDKEILLKASEFFNV